MRGDNALGELDLLPATDAEPVLVGVIEPEMPAAQVLQVGDRVLAFNDTSVRNTATLRQMVGETKGTPFKLTIERGGERKVVDINATDTKDGFRIGVGFAKDKIQTREPASISQAASFAVNSNLEVIRLTGKVFGQLFAGERSPREAGLAGPIGIVQIIAQVMREQGFVGLISILALISLNLGVFNLLPIPMLDGGQIALLAVEGFLGLFGIAVSMAVKEKIQLVGLGIILLLMVTTIFFDISRLFGKRIRTLRIAPALAEISGDDRRTVYEHYARAGNSVFRRVVYGIAIDARANCRIRQSRRRSRTSRS
jgi:regulator of sigma E protease